MKTTILSCALILAISLSSAYSSEAQTRTHNRGKIIKEALAAKKDNRTTTDEARRQEIRSGLLSISKNDNIAAVSKTAPSLPEYLIQEDGTVLRQSAKKMKLNTESSSIVPINENNIYPGCIVYANQSLLDGYPQEVDFGKGNQLGKVTVYVNFFTGAEVSEHNVDANGSSVRAAIGRLLQKGLNNGVVPPAQVEEVRKTYTSIEKMAVDMGCSVNYLNVKCKVDTKTTTSSETIYTMDSFSQAFYTVMIEPENKDKSNYFGTGVTWSDIKNAISVGRNAPLAIITSVTYGRRGFYKKEYSATDFTFKGNDTIAYKTNALYSAQDISRSSKTSDQYGYIYGGSANTAGQALSPEDFNTKIKSNMVVSMTNQGIPIFYTVQYLASDAFCKSVTTGTYNEVSYAPAINRLNLDVTQSATVMHGTNTVELRKKYKVVKIDSNPASKSFGKVISTRSVDLDSYKWSNNAGKSFQIDLGKDEYFDNNEIYIQLKTRIDATRSWNTKKEGYIDVSGAVDGPVYIKITGHYRKSLNLSTDEIKKNGKTVGNYIGFKGSK